MTVRYYVDISLDHDELEELVEGDHDLPAGLWEKLSGHLDYVRARLDDLERARRLGVVSIDRLRWNAEMDRMFEAET